MSEHTPQHDPCNPASTSDTRLDTRLDTGTDGGAEATQTDLVAGDPPVPLTVWRTVRTGSDAHLGTTRSIGARLAARLVAAYSRPGEVVVDLTDGHGLIQACAAGGRRHHRAWFTDAASLIIGPATPIPPTGTPSSTASGATGATGDEEQDDVPELSVWFGDDLTDPDLPGRTTDPVSDLPPSGSLQQATSLVVACWPLDEVDAANRVRLAWLLTACARLLRPGGCLILVVTVPASSTTRPEDFSGVVNAAAGVGLGYLQHIVAVCADISDDGDAFVYHVTDEELLSLVSTAGATGGRWQVAHLRVHADLLVFSQTRKSASSPWRAGREAGGRRG